MNTAIPFPLVSKSHAVCCWLFAAIFLLATFDINFPIIGPAALLNGWNTGNPSLMYIVRFLVALLVGVGLFEWVFAESASAKRPFVQYHAVLAILALYSSVAAANGVLGWIYAIFVVVFLIASILGTTDDSSSAPMESVSDEKMPMVAMSHAVCCGIFGIIFLLATFNLSFPIIGPAALLRKWHMDNAALVYCVRFVAGLLVGVGLFEWVFSKAVKMQPSFNIYHAIAVVLVLYSSVAAASGALGWLYGGLLTVFLVAGVVANRM